MADRLTVEDLYTDYDGDVHREFGQVLDDSLEPLGRDLMFDLVAELALPAGAPAVDVGCRRGYHAIELARRFGLRVHGVDPMRPHIDDARAAIAESDVAGLVTADVGVGQSLPEADGSVALVWCRDVLVHVADLTGMFTEWRRVLRPDGHAVVFQMLAGDWLEPLEAQRLWAGAAVVPASTDRAGFEAAIAAGGLTITRNVDLGSQWRETAVEEGSWSPSKDLLRTARLLRDRERLVARFGERDYRIMVSSCLWGIYQMIGKLSPRVYVLGR